MFIQEGRLNYPTHDGLPPQHRRSPIEQVGAQLRAMMPWIKARTSWSTGHPQLSARLAHKGHPGIVLPPGCRVRDAPLGQARERWP